MFLNTELCIWNTWLIIQILHIHEYRAVSINKYSTRLYGRTNKLKEI